MHGKKIEGKISFIHHDKDRAVIEYDVNGKTKTIQANISRTAQEQLKKQHLIKKIHRYMIGDTVSFEIGTFGGKADRVGNLQYLYNTSLGRLIDQSATDNKFLGYVKQVGDQYFIKEIDTYLFFPLTVSPYEIAPTETDSDEAVLFKLEHTEKPEQIQAVLYNHQYIPEFSAAVKHHKKGISVLAHVEHISTHGIHVGLFGGKLKAKIVVDAAVQQRLQEENIELGNTIPVLIRHLTPMRLVAEWAKPVN